MKSIITCPKCKTAFNLEDVITDDVEKNLQVKYEAQNQILQQEFERKNAELTKSLKDFEIKKKNENELFADKLARELEKTIKEKETSIKAKLEEEQAAKLKFLEEQQTEQAAKLKLMQQQELEMLGLKKKLQEQQDQEAFNLEKQRLEVEQELREKISTEVLDKQREKFELEKRELEKQLNDQKKLTEQMTRKLEQGSMQTQGEVQELALESLLAQSFPFDVIEEVPKGSNGADSILIVRNEVGQLSGKIIFECKRTKDFNKDWLGKLKDDAKLVNADACVLVTHTFPKDMKQFDQRDGVWICHMQEVSAVVKLIREGIINVYRAQKTHENRGEKKEMLYLYFTSHEFRNQMRSMNEAYLFLKGSIDKERLQMEKIWKEREKQIDRILLNNSHLIGSIQGIAGEEAEDMNLLDGQ
jgi:hypothetical protein